MQTQCSAQQFEFEAVERRSVVAALVGQRVLGLALGYEDLIDHDELRHDPLWAAALGKLEPQRRSGCAALAGKSTLNRLERTPHSMRYHKIGHRPEAIERLFVELFLDAYAHPLKDFVYRTLDSWSAARRVVGKAEHLPAGANPRFIITSLEPAQWEG